MCIGGVLGHSICTLIAVLGGRIVAQRISIRTGAPAAVRRQRQPIRGPLTASGPPSASLVTLIGGVVFLVFALSGLILEAQSTAEETTAAVEAAI